jgi:hypothetical protein
MGTGDWAEPGLTETSRVVTLIPAASAILLVMEASPV